MSLHQKFTDRAEDVIAWRWAKFTVKSSMDSFLKAAHIRWILMGKNGC